MKIWQKNYDIDREMESFTVGKDRELDLQLARFDVLGSMAHCTMLQKIGLLEAEELSVLLKGLKEIYEQIEAGTFTIDNSVEDVHSEVEKRLTESLGEIGKKIHSGRSRNDQVLVDLRLFLREEIREITEITASLFEALLETAEKYQHVLMPGYTHLQVAMPSSVGLWASAYAESLADDMILMEAAYRHTNQNPLGSAAGYGSSFPLNRKMTTKLLGFANLSYNAIYAQMGRGKTEMMVAMGMQAIAATIGKMAMDVALYMGQNFAFFRFPDELTTGSSIMPHKKNPDLFELVRARANRVQSLPSQLTMLIANLPAGYHRDFQLLKEPLFTGLEDLKALLKITLHALPQMEVRESILEDSRYKYLFSVEAVNKEVLNGVPFRDAYRKIGQQIADGTYQDQKEVAHSHEGSIGNLCLPEIRQKMETHLAAFDFKTSEEAFERLLGSVDAS